MGRKDDILEHIEGFLIGDYEIASLNRIPTVNELGYGRMGKEFSAAALYADMRHSSAIVERHTMQAAARIYKSYQFAMADIIRHNGGEIRSYDGDRVMALFHPSDKGDNSACVNAVKAGREMAWFFHTVLKNRLGGFAIPLDCGIGIAFGQMLAIRAGLRSNPDSNDVIWVGRAANIAAKLSDRGHRPNYIYVDQEIRNRVGGVKWKKRRLRFANNRFKVYSTRDRLEFD